MAEEVQAAWWDKVKDDVDSERTFAFTAAERDEKRRIAAEAAGDTKLAEVIQEEIALRDVSYIDMEKSEDIERRAKRSQRDTEQMRVQ